MFFIGTLHMTMLGLLVGSTTAHQCPLHDVKPGTVFPVMDSLQCYNDYKTYVQCTWEEDSHIHSRAAENGSSRLYYRERMDNKDTLCALLGPGVALSNGKTSYSCRYNTKRFVTGTSHTVYFKVPCESGAKTFSVAQHGKVLSPIDLTEKRSDNGGHVLSWKSPYPASSNITRMLTYQLQYSMDGQDWTTVDNISASEFMIDKQMLLPGYLYQARVRARGAVGLWSNWSQPVSWRTHNDGAFNLQCVIGDTNVMCSWQMKTEISHFMSYRLWCRHSDTQASKPSVCCETPLLKSRGAEVSEFYCPINTSDPYLLTVELRPVYHSRQFHPSENIQLPQPDPVHVKEADGVFSLSWSTPTAYVPERFFIQLKISTNETSELYNLTGNAGFEISSNSLHPSTQYKAQIRFLLRASHELKGLPSKWSQPKVFTTGPASWSITTIIYILVSVIVAGIFIGFYNALPVCHRRIKLWNGSIPSPINSRVMEEIIKKSSSAWPYLQGEKEKTSLCVMQATDNISICKSSISGEPLLLHTEVVSSDATAVKKGWSDGSLHSGPYVLDSMYQDNSGMSFSGPYILCCEESCGQDKIFDTSSDRCHTCLSGTSENSGPTNGGYVVTPPMLANQNPTPVDSSTINPSEEPPAYTPKLDQGRIVHLHPSGYFMMPCSGVSQLEPRGYVALSQPGT
ncbi:cytokine receptor common subunit beta [Triplophysa rosa]|uniref:Colony stimulating factor 2 receptor n=1 Tax=Triplophysa rosa TaxID=992332 RepID=A0A9W7TTF3_TRIRA|nr:cytokine receptor common subunit beta [Triplophysa rosa]XP_057203218.1 cytokine receptor common subunit beta [Triplophysa rosa]KAI7802985.1 putative colony stimulating factor 2 receptor [Triplophysa rosa]